MLRAKGIRLAELAKPKQGRCASRDFLRSLRALPFARVRCFAPKALGSRSSQSQRQRQNIFLFFVPNVNGNVKTQRQRQSQNTAAAAKSRHLESQRQSQNTAPTSTAVREGSERGFDFGRRCKRRDRKGKGVMVQKKSPRKKKNKTSAYFA